MNLQDIADGAPFDTTTAIRMIAGRVVSIAANMDAAGAGASLAPGAVQRGTHLDLDVLPDRIAAALRAAGYDTPQAVQAATDDDLLDVDGIGDASLKDIRDVFPTT